MRRDRLLRQLLMDRFTVTLAGGESFDGLLAEVDDKTIRLVDAFAVDGKNRVSVDGDLYLPRAGIIYLQRPGAGS